MVDQLGAPPFARPGWFAAWWPTFAERPPVLVAARARDRLVGLLPLRRRAGGLASPTNAHTPGFGVLAEEAAIAGVLADAVLAMSARRVQLDYVDADDPGAARIEQVAEARNRRVLRLITRRSPYLSLSGPGESVDVRLSSKVASNLRRVQRRLSELGRLEVDVADGRDGLTALLAEGLRLEASGWKAERGTAIESSWAARRFYAAMATWAAQRGILRLAFLRLDGRGIAFQLGLEEAGAYYLIKGGYDPDMRRYAPGKLLARAMIARAVAEGLQRFEFLGAEEPWKLEWSPRFHERTLLRIFAPSALGTVDHAAQSAYLRYARPLAKRAVAHLR